MQPAMARELFSAGFVSCWSELDNASQQALVSALICASVARPAAELNTPKAATDGVEDTTAASRLLCMLAGI